ncbi:MAG TPA: EamA family transporter [Thermoleophilaceae bacterium]|nr:EamA family transporter [Thermoleophilaceae bacterium]
MSAEPAGARAPARRRPGRGYALAAAGATMWAMNGNLARYLLDDGVSAVRLAQLRSAGSWLLLLFGLGLARRDLIPVRRRELPALAFLGIAGLALVHATYFVAIQHLEIGVAVTIQYLAPLVLLVWLRLVHGRRLPPSLWGAVALSVVGCFFVVRAYHAGALDGVGVAAAFAAMITFAIYMVGSERAGHRHEPVTTLFWAFGFASLFWAVVEPWWSFPFGQFGSARHILLAAGVVVVGTLLPFICMVAALRHIPAPRAAVVATLEPVLAAVFAEFLHDERLAAVQIAGGLAVVAAVLWVQARRPDLEAELAPPAVHAR